METKVAIIGAGISGLLACRYILNKGLTPIVFEALNDIGGIWFETLDTTTLQTSKDLYQFSDHAWPDSVTAVYPSKQEVMDYFQSYAVRFNILDHIRFNSKVVSLRYEGANEEEIEAWSYWGGTGDPFGKGKWILNVQNTLDQSIEEYQFDFVILTVGKYSGLANIPKFPPGKGPETFKGKVIHSMDCSKMETGFMKAETPVIVGLGKTALDIAMSCSASNGVENPCTLVYRSKYWLLPEDAPIPVEFLFLNRFRELLIHKPEEGFLHKLITTMLSPLNWCINKYVERTIIKTVNLQKYDMIPEQSVLEDSNSCAGAHLPDGFFKRVDEGSIKLVKSQNFSFSEDGIWIEDATKFIKTKLVILCTGFRGGDKVQNMFTSPAFKKYISGSHFEDLAQLYREMIHPRIPQLAVVGFAQSISNLQTAEMSSRWVAELLDGNIKLPCIKDMELNMADWEKHMKPSTYKKRCCVGAFNIWFYDQLCKDMGKNPNRKKSVFSELFEAYGPLDYAQL